MKLYTYSITPKPKTSKLFKVLLLIVFLGVFVIFALGAFGFIFHENNIVVGIMILLLFFVMSAVAGIISSDCDRSYIEIDGDNIRVVDYYFGIAKTKHFSKCEVHSYEVVSGNSMKLRGPRLSKGYVKYIVFRDKNNEYLFKIFYHDKNKEALKGILL